MFSGIGENLSVALRRFIPPPEHRPRREIEAEVREEIEFHLAMTAERIVQEERLDTDAAKAEALKRFGDPESITRECTRIALKERIMLQRINTVLIALVAVGLIVVGIGTWQQQAQTAAAFEQINEKLTGMAAPVSDGPATGAPEDPPALPLTNPEQVEVHANPDRGGVRIPLDSELTLKAALDKAIGSASPVPTADLLITVIRSDGRGERQPIASRIPATSVFSLENGDEIHVVGSASLLPWTMYTQEDDDRSSVTEARSRLFRDGSSDGQQNTSLSVFENAASVLELRLVIDPDDLEYHDYDLDRTIPRAFLETLTIEQALDYICHTSDFVNYNELLWDIHDGMLIVGSAETIAKRALTTATYRVDDLLGPFPSREAYEDLRKILTTSAGFDTWRDNGGSIGIYSEVEGRLSITTIPRLHRTIVSLLEKLRDPQQQYPRNPITDELAEETFARLSGTSIGGDLSPQTTIIEAVRHATERARLACHIDEHQLATIGFEGDEPIGRVPDSDDSAARLIREWLLLASPDDFDRAGWMAYGGGVAVSTERALSGITKSAVYDLRSLKDTVDSGFTETIIQLIQTRVDFDGWRDNGGDTGIIQSFDDLLVITTTNTNHTDIVRLLDEYRSANTP